MQKIDLYTAVHKMQRARLFALTVDAGRRAPGDTAAARSLAGAVDELVAELRAHAGHEDRFIHPLLRRRAPEVARRLDDGHAALEPLLDGVAAAARQGTDPSADPNVLYRLLATFTARYLDHVADEEGTALPVLWERCPDDELAEVLTSFRASRSAPHNLASVLAQLPYLHADEIARMAEVGLAEVPDGELDDLLATLLGPRRLGDLVGRRVAPATATGLDRPSPAVTSAITNGRWDARAGGRRPPGRR